MSHGDLKSYDNVIAPSSRYRISSRLVRYDKKIVFDIPSRVTTDNDDNDKFVVVNSSNENRLDLISQANYGTPKYWWVIADVNKISNPFVVPVGTVLRLPPMSNIIMTGVVS